MNQLKINDLYSTKYLSFIRPNEEMLYFNAACHTPISIQAYEAATAYHESFGVCSGRNSGAVSENLDNLITETRNLILKHLKLEKDEWEVVFCQNATAALNMATNIIAHYLRRNYYQFGVSYHSLGHNSLIIPAKKVIKKYLVMELDLPIDLKFSKEHQKVHKLISMPYIDNAIGYNHYGYYHSTIDNRKFMGFQSNYQHIILDACQAATTIFNPIKTGLPSVAPCAAIAFSAHKLHSEHLGILVIRKKYLTDIDLFEIDGLIAGGGTIACYDYHGKPILHKDHKGLEGGLLNEAAILALGAWLKYLSTCRYDLSGEMKKYTSRIRSELAQCAAPDIIPVQLEQYRKLRENGFTNNNIILLKSPNFTASDISSRLYEQHVDNRVGKFCVDYGFNKFGLDDAVRISLDWSINNDKPYREVDRLITAIAEVSLQVGEIKQALNKTQQPYG